MQHLKQNTNVGSSVVFTAMHCGWQMEDFVIVVENKKTRCSQVFSFKVYIWKNLAMTEFFDGMEPLLRTFWYVAIPTSLIFLIQTVLTFVGGDVADGVEADFDSNLTDGSTPFQLFSLRNLIHFLLGFSWSGLAFYNSISSPALLLLVATVVGASFVYLFFLVLLQVSKLAEDNSFRIAQTVGQTAEVYLRIPAANSGKGKVMLSVRGSVHELDAITAGDELPSGSMVKIESVAADNLLVVSKI